jgi:hypothetical protein
VRRALYYVLGISLVFIGWRHFQRVQLAAMGEAESAPAAGVDMALPERPDAAAAYRCDGRVYCSQMHSCEEATWFLAHCPGMKMDGDRDGIPCEKQWCER